MLRYLPGGEMGGLHVVAGREDLGGIAVVVAGLQDADVGFGDLGVLLAELLLDEA